MVPRTSFGALFDTHSSNTTNAKRPTINLAASGNKSHNSSRSQLAKSHYNILSFTLRGLFISSQTESIPPIRLTHQVGSTSDADDLRAESCWLAMQYGYATHMATGASHWMRVLTRCNPRTSSCTCPKHTLAYLRAWDGVQGDGRL